MTVDRRQMTRKEISQCIVQCADKRSVSVAAVIKKNLLSMYSGNICSSTIRTDVLCSVEPVSGRERKC